MYNDILKTLLPVEKPLLKKRIEGMDASLQEGIDKLTWNSQSIDSFISHSNATVSDVDQLVKKMKDNVLKMQDMMGNWMKPLFERKAKTMAPDDLESTHASLVMPRHEDIRSNGKDIQKLVKDTTEAIKPDKKSHQWLAYVDYLNSLVIEGVTEGINASMEFLANQISIKYNRLHNNAPMFDIKVDLADNNVCFDPSIECNEMQTGIRDILQNIINDFIQVAVLVPRLDAVGDRTGDYLVEMKDQFMIYGSMQMIQSNFQDIVNSTDGFIGSYKDKEFLWKEKLEDSFREFLESGDDPREKVHLRKNADGEDEEDPTFAWMANRILDGVETRKPDLEAFDQKITFLYRMRNEINEMRPTVEIGWLKVNAMPLIKELQAIIKQWIDCYTNFLLNNTIREVSNIDSFIKEVSEGIMVLPEESKIHQQSEKDLLMRVMTHLRDVKMIQARTHNEIEPMK
jgi:dynein heavy chain